MESLLSYPLPFISSQDNTQCCFMIRHELTKRLFILIQTMMAEKIANLIAESGTGGALGLLGGTKAYFYARLTKRKKGDILSIHITELAPAQNW